MKQKKEQTTSSVVKRAHFRFTPSEPSLAMIDVRTRAKVFKVQFYGLVISEAFGGCALITTNTEDLQVKSIVSIVLHDLAPVKAEVVWRKIIDPQAIKIGLKFIEENKE